MALGEESFERSCPTYAGSVLTELTNVEVTRELGLAGHT